jgi:hypothetical protein
MNRDAASRSLPGDRAGFLPPDLIPLAAFLCVAEYDDDARSIILDRVAAGVPLVELTCPAPDGSAVLEPCDLDAASAALARGRGACPARGWRAAMGPSDPVALPEAQAGCQGEPSHSTAANGQPLTLAEAVDHEAIAYRAWGTPLGDFLSRQMERLAQLIWWTGAATPDEHDARMEVWDDSLRRQWEERGHAAGREAGRREGWDRALREIRLLLREGPHWPDPARPADQSDPSP